MSDLEKENAYLREELRRCKIRNLNLTFPKPETLNLPETKASETQPVKVEEKTMPPEVVPLVAMAGPVPAAAAVSEAVLEKPKEQKPEQPKVSETAHP